MESMEGEEGIIRSIQKEVDRLCPVSYELDTDTGVEQECSYEVKPYSHLGGRTIGVISNYYAEGYPGGYEVDFEFPLEKAAEVLAVLKSAETGQRFPQQALRDIGCNTYY